MQLRPLCRADLNTLVALQALLEEQSVSRASERVFVTQSAMSKTLQRLRQMFNDPLFTRSAQKMVPTPKALELKEQLPDILQGIQDLISEREFDAKRFTGEFSVYVDELLGSALFPPLIEALNERAPGISLITKSEPSDQFALLANGSIDFSLHVGPDWHEAILPSSEFYGEELGGKRPKLIARLGHPLFCEETEPTIEELARFPQIRIAAYEDYGCARDFLSLNGSNLAEVAPSYFETPHLFTALQVLKRTNGILIAAVVLTDTSVASSVAIRALPREVDDENVLSGILIGHRRTANSVAHQWLRKLIAEVLLPYKGMPHQLIDVPRTSVK